MSEVDSTSVGQRWIEYISIDDLKPAERNPKQHADRDIQASMNRFGYTESIVLDERTGKMVAGHGRLDALVALRDSGAEPPEGVGQDWAVPVSRGWASKNDDEANAYLVASNQTAILGGWDDSELLALLDLLDDLDGTGFTLEMLRELEQHTSTLPKTPLTDPDHVPEAPKKPITQLGDIWLLGPHRVMCGNSVNIEDVRLLINGDAPAIVYTDPPYGIDIVTNSSAGGDTPVGSVGGGKVVKTRQYRPVIGDESTQTAVDAYRICVALGHRKMIFWGGNYFASALPDSSCWLVWDKQNTGNFADCELAWTNLPGAVRMFTHMWNGMIRASEHGPRVHPTQKPVALGVWALEKYSELGDYVLDLFGGSGSTLIACEQTNRNCLMLELDPQYVDVICRRYQEHTGTLPVLESTGKAVDFTSGS